MNIQQIYIAFLGRPADPEGLRYWNRQLSAGEDIFRIAARIVDQTEFQILFKDMPLSTVVEIIFQNLFNRSPSVAEMNSFLLKAEDSQFVREAIRIVETANGSDLSTLKVKINAADTFTSKVDSSAEITDYHGENAASIGRNFLKEVSDIKHASDIIVSSALREILISNTTNAQLPKIDSEVVSYAPQYSLNATISPHQTINGKQFLLISDGSAEGFAIATDSVSMLELGISVRNTSGAIFQSRGYDENNVAIFEHVDATNTMLVLSVASLGQQALSKFNFKLSIDYDPSENISLKNYSLHGNADSSYFWALDANDIDVFSNPEYALHQVLPISYEQGHFMLLDKFSMGDQAGIIDARIEASQNGSVLTKTAVRLDFNEHIPIIGVSEASII